MLNKKNTFLDFISCTKYLINNNYSSEKNNYIWRVLIACRNVLIKFQNSFWRNNELFHLLITLLQTWIIHYHLTRVQLREFADAKNNKSTLNTSNHIPTRFRKRLSKYFDYNISIRLTFYLMSLPNIVQ